MDMRDFLKKFSMRKIYKITNIALIFMLIRVFLWSSLAYSLPDFYNLRPASQFNLLSEQSREFLQQEEDISRILEELNAATDFNEHAVLLIGQLIEVVRRDHGVIGQILNIVEEKKLYTAAYFLLQSDFQLLVRGKLDKNQKEYVRRLDELAKETHLQIEILPVLKRDFGTADLTELTHKMLDNDKTTLSLLVGHPFSRDILIYVLDQVDNREALTIFDNIIGIEDFRENKEIIEIIFEKLFGRISLEVLIENLRRIILELNQKDAQLLLTVFTQKWVEKALSLFEISEGQGQKELLKRLGSKETQAAITSYFESLKRLSSLYHFDQPIGTGTAFFPTNEGIKDMPPLAFGTVLAGVSIEQLFTFAISGRFWEIYHLDFSPRVAKLTFPLLGLFFLTADNRAEWLALLFGVPLDKEEAASLDGKPIGEIRNTLLQKGSDKNYRAAIAKIAADILREYLEKEEDKKKVESMVDEFLNSIASDLLVPRGKDIFVEQFWNESAYLATEFDYHFIKLYWKTKRVSGAVTNISDPMYLSKVFEDIKSKNLILGAFYVSTIPRGTDVIGPINFAAEKTLGQIPLYIITTETRPTYEDGFDAETWVIHQQKAIPLEQRVPRRRSRTDS